MVVNIVHINEEKKTMEIGLGPSEGRTFETWRIVYGEPGEYDWERIDGDEKKSRLYCYGPYAYNCFLTHLYGVNNTNEIFDTLGLISEGNIHKIDVESILGLEPTEEVSDGTFWNRFLEIEMDDELHLALQEAYYVNFRSITPRELSTISGLSEEIISKIYTKRADIEDLLYNSYERFVNLYKQEKHFLFLVPSLFGSMDGKLYYRDGIYYCKRAEF